VWLAATAFNFLIGASIVLATEWSFDLAYGPSGDTDNAMAQTLWRDFGIFVLLIGVGYYIVARDVTRNHGLALLGIFAKLFDVVALTTRFFLGLAAPIVLVPAAIDGVFALMFVVFLVWARRTRPHSTT
jgi:hypothetical protein